MSFTEVRNSSISLISSKVKARVTDQDTRCRAHITDTLSESVLFCFAEWPHFITAKQNLSQHTYQVAMCFRPGTEIRRPVGHGSGRLDGSKFQQPLILCAIDGLPLPYPSPPAFVTGSKDLLGLATSEKGART